MKTTNPTKSFFFLLQTLQKRKYLSVIDYDEKYFDFHCLPGGEEPKDYVDWYTICGTPFENHVEYIMVVGGICWTAFIVFFNMHFLSGSEIVYRNKKVKFT